MSKSLKTAPFPKRVDPMLCTLVEHAFDDDAWIFEPKLDGLRVLCYFDPRKSLSLLSRNDKRQDRQFPEICDALGRALTRPAVVDGEIVSLDERGRPSFKALQQRFHVEDDDEVRRRMREYPASIYLFDVLYVDRSDVRDRPLFERKNLLRRAVTRWRPPVLWTEAIRGKGIKLLNDTCRASGEGIVAKRLDSPYVATRSGAWLKIKCIGRQEFVIGGWTDPQRSRVGLGALLVGYYDRDGKTLIYAGKVGTGFTRETLLDIRERLDAIGADRNPFDEGKPPRGEQVHWVKPKLVGEIAFAEWTRHGILRQPRFEGLREDKRPKQVRREVAKLSGKPPARIAKEARPI